MLPLCYDCLVVLCLNWFFLVWLRLYACVQVYMCAECVVAYVKNHYSSTKRSIFAQYICMRRVCCCVLQIITAGSICTLITLHFAVSFTITNNSFDVEALYRSCCLIRPSSIQSIWGREGEHFFQRALNRSSVAESEPLYFVYFIIRCVECFRHVLRLHNPQTNACIPHNTEYTHTPWTTQFHLISTAKHTCIQSTHTHGNAIKYNAMPTISSAKWMPKTVCVLNAHSFPFVTISFYDYHLVRYENWISKDMPSIF